MSAEANEKENIWIKHIFRDNDSLLFKTKFWKVLWKTRTVEAC